ncbi:hypothetical protein [Bizionia myxarmorum]|uniref:DUF3244 domain-containing protein n=1 Tax=Bizionia myxarmorum TaxID=291186 RepID=A0A5D0RAM4_9FLAO|nr:hypothetical protein [Bizionia myxarmorum]TYB78710.1 hypothetical protein ES674_02725 [Bizionia myxarmorum]
MRNSLLLFMLLSILSCSRATDALINEAFPPPQNLEIAIKNNTNTKLLRTEIITANGSLVFQQIEPESYSGFYEVSAVYSEVEITVQTANGFYAYSPVRYDENTLVTKGRYYFEVSLEIPGNNLVVTRKSF